MRPMANSSYDEDDNYAMKFNLLYTVYSIPNIILPFFGGTIVDQLGAPYSACIFTALTLCGQFIFAMGSQYKLWPIMFLGRVVYGFGGENMTVSLSTLLSIWFQGKEMALAFGMNLAVSRIGSVLNNWISPAVANRYSASFAIWLGLIMNFASFIAVGFIIYLTYWGEEQIKKRRNQTSSDIVSLSAALLEDYHNDESQTFGLSNNVEEKVVVDGEKVQVGKDNDDLVHGDSGDDESVSISNKDQDDSIGDICNSKNDHEIESYEQYQSLLQQCNHGEIDENAFDPPSTRFKFVNDIGRFGMMFWLLSVSCIVVYGCVIPFNNIASGILLERNYFKPSPTGCTLKMPNQCSTGDLAPYEGNPAVDSNDDNCTIRDTSQPVIPTSLEVYDTQKNDTEWEHDSYVFQHLKPDDIDCGDPFWSHACTQDYCSAQNRATETSGKIMSIPYFISAIASPFFGHVVDKVGYRAMIACLASIILVFVHLTLALSESSPVMPLVGQGLAYTLYASVIWPSVPLTVDEEATGTAFGTLTAVQNIGLSIFPLFIAKIYSVSGNSYIPNVELFFVSCALFGTLIGIILNFFDKRNGGLLNRVERRVLSI